MGPRCVPSTAGHSGKIRLYFDFRAAKPLLGRRKIGLDLAPAVSRLVVGFACFEVSIVWCSGPPLGETLYRSSAKRWGGEGSC
jgi:hypothetical protein